MMAALLLTTQYTTSKLVAVWSGNADWSLEVICNGADATSCPVGYACTPSRVEPGVSICVPAPQAGANATCYSCDYSGGTKDDCRVACPSGSILSASCANPWSTPPYLKPCQVNHASCVLALNTTTCGEKPGRCVVIPCGAPHASAPTTPVPEECQAKDGIHQHQPQFHVIAPMFKRPNVTHTWPGGVNDANAMFQHHGVFHMMHQCDGGPPGVPCGGGWEGPNTRKKPGEQTYFHSWGHVISKDLAHWHRVADALVPNETNFEHGADCDGTVSFLGDSIGPVAMYGPGCGWKKEMSDGGGGGDSLGDAAFIGTAFPVASSSDSELIQWAKRPDQAVTWSPGSPPCSFAGTVWRINTTLLSMVCTDGKTRARYTTTASNVSTSFGLEGPWTLVDSAFGGGGAIGGESGPSFLPLPSPKKGEPTHIISAGSGSFYALATFDTATEKLNATSFDTLDFGALAWTAAGLADDGRILLAGWVRSGSDPVADASGCPEVKGITVCGVECESIVRVLTYEATTNALLAYPPAEIATLRNASLYAGKEIKLKASGVATALGPLPRGTGSAIDVMLEVDMTSFTTGTITVRVFANTTAGGLGTGGVAATLRVEPLDAKTERRTVVVNGNAANTFVLLKDEATLSVRVLVDRSIAEFFFQSGRAAYTKRYYGAKGGVESGVQIASDAVGGTTIVKVAIYEMGCGWV